MNNLQHILRTLDRHLTGPVEITLFGRAALALGYAPSSPAFAATQDVDAILSLAWLAAEDENLDFWEAQQRTNAELKPEELYLTHLFSELEVILTPDWLSRRVQIPLGFRHLAVVRPAQSRGAGQGSRTRRSTNWLNSQPSTLNQLATR